MKRNFGLILAFLLALPLAAQTTPSATYCNSAIPWYMYNNHFYICANGSPQQVDGAGGPPTGAAGGALTGTYPNPGLAAATSSTLGGVKPDGTSIINTAGAISATAASVGADASGAAAARAGTGNCTSGQYETGDATGGPSCAQVAYSQVSGTPATEYPLFVYGGNTDSVTCATAFAGSGNVAPFATSYTIPANTLKVGTVLRVSYNVYFAASGAPGVSVLTYIGGVLLPSGNTGLNNSTEYGQTYLIQGTVEPASSAAVLAGSITQSCSTAGACGAFNVVFGGAPTVTVATNGPLVIQPKLYCSAGTAGNTMTLYQMMVEEVAPGS